MTQKYLLSATFKFKRLLTHDKNIPILVSCDLAKLLNLYS